MKKLNIIRKQEAGYVHPVITDTSITPIYSWQCDTSCFANGMTMPTITRQLTDTNSCMINCSVTFNGDEYMNDITFYMQITEGIKVSNYNYVLF